MLADYADHDQAIGLDWYALDPNLSLLLDRYLPDKDDRTFAEEHVACYGELVGMTLAARAEVTDANGPVLHRYDRWGYDVGEVAHHPAWTANKADLVRTGFVGLERQTGRPVPAVVTAARAYLLSQCETAAYCALGMTGGAVDIVERYAPPTIRDLFVSRLTSPEPVEAWEGGMFLTERQGGSDVGANTTRAVPDGGEWLLFGDKHFCSNVDADVFIVLARPEGAPEGTRGLATFIVPSRQEDGSPNGFTIKRLKPKLGTVGVPTGEVTLAGARAWLAGGDPTATRPRAPGDGRGINRMMEMVNSSRFGVALMGLGIHRRSFLEAAIYAAQRTQWGQRIDRYPLVRETLVDLLVDLEAGMAITFECAGAVRGAADPDEARLLRRILIPLAKMRCTRVALWAASGALEIFGGNGYMHDWPIARQLRDAQCHTIWEGTENILALDVRRSIRADAAHLALGARIDRALAAAGDHRVLADAKDVVARVRREAWEAVSVLSGAQEDLALLQSRRLAELLADTAEAALLLEEAGEGLREGSDARKAAVARRFVSRKLADRPLRGVLDRDRSVLDLFEPLVRYGPIEPGRLVA